MKRLLLTALAILALGPAHIALAPSSLAQSTSTPQTEVTFDQADLIDPARLDALHARIEIAARDVCREAFLGDLLRPVTIRACIRDTTARAMAQLADHHMTVLATNDAVQDRQR